MHTYNKIINKIDRLIINYINHNYSGEVEKQRMRMDFLRGFEKGFELIIERGIPSSDYWREPTVRCQKEGLKQFILLDPAQVGGLIGSLVSVLNDRSLATKYPYIQIIQCLSRDWPQFYNYIQTLIS